MLSWGRFDRLLSLMTPDFRVTEPFLGMQHTCNFPWEIDLVVAIGGLVGVQYLFYAALVSLGISKLICCQFDFKIPAHSWEKLETVQKLVQSDLDHGGVKV